MGPSLGVEQTGPICVFCFVQRRDFRDVKRSDLADLIRFDLVFFVGCIGFVFRLGQARMRSTVLCCLLCWSSQEGGGAIRKRLYFDWVVYSNISWFCKTIVVVVVPVCSPDRIACFYLVSVQFNPLPFSDSGPARQALKKGERGKFVKGLTAPHFLEKGCNFSRRCTAQLVFQTFSSLEPFSVTLVDSRKSWTISLGTSDLV